MSSFYWDQKHLEYLTKDWIGKPNYFAQTTAELISPKSKILELGCGQGQDSRFFNKLGHQVIATDFSKKALEIAKTKTNSPNIDYQYLDLTKKFNYMDNEFDAVYSHLSLHYFDKNKTVLIFNEIKRVLKKGGYLALLLNSTRDKETKTSKLVEPNFYLLPYGIKKRYFNTDTVKQYIKSDYKVLILDDKGKTYKDQNSLVRFIGLKI